VPIVVVKRQTVDKGQLQAARDLAKHLFGKIGPDGEDALDAYLRESLGTWRGNLARYRTLADTGDYPGSQAIADAAAVVAKLLAEKESFGLIGKLLERKSDLLDLSDDIHELDNFYETQRPTWEKLRKAYNRFQPNRTWLDKDPTAAAALRRMSEILDAASPYGMVKEADALIQKAEAIDTDLVAQHREQAQSAIDDQFARVEMELDAAKASSDLRNDCLLPLQSLKRQIASQTSIAHIDQAALGAVDLADEAFRRIESAAKRQAEKSGGIGEVPPKPYVKRRVVKAAALAPKALLETKEDIDAYLDKLRRALEAVIGAGERVEIR
jgi:hypothetical protein